MTRTKKKSFTATSVSAYLRRTTIDDDTAVNFHKLPIVSPSRHLLFMRSAAAVPTDATMAHMCATPCTRRLYPPPRLIPPFAKPSRSNFPVGAPLQATSIDPTSSSFPSFLFHLQASTNLSSFPPQTVILPMSPTKSKLSPDFQPPRHSLLPRPFNSADSCFFISCRGRS